MRKFAIATAAVVLLVAGSAQAKNMGGHFGLGYDQSLGGSSGLALTYWVTDALGLDATLGLSMAFPDKVDGGVGFDMSLGARYNIARAKDVNLGVGLRLSMAFLNKEANGQDSVFGVNIELPLTVEYFFSDHFAISLATGIVIEIIPEDGKPLHVNGQPKYQDAGRKGIGLHIGAGGLFGTAGFRFYF